MENKEVARVDNKIDLWADKLKEAIPTNIKFSFPEDKIRSVVAGFLITAKKNPKIYKCESSSIMSALYNCLETDLIPGSRDECALIPRNNKKKDDKGNTTYVLELTFQPMVQGLVKLAYDSGNVLSIETEVIHENDIFEYEQGLNPKLIFKKELFKERGKRLGAYALIFLVNGSHIIEIMPTSEIEAIREKADNEFVWKPNLNEMYRKTVFKRASKRIDKSDKLAKAIEKDNELERPDIAGKLESKSSPINQLLENKTIDREDGTQLVLEPQEPVIEDFTQYASESFLTGEK